MPRAAGRGLATGSALVLALLALLAPIAHAQCLESTAPRFRVKTIQGKPLDLDALRRDGPVLIDFWATWCKPCINAIPEIEQIHRDYAGRGLTVIGVSADGPRNFAKVRPFVKNHGMTYDVVLDDDGDLQQKFQVQALPTTVLIDREGRIVQVVLGFRHGESERIRRAIGPLLEKPGANAAPESAAADSARSDR